MCVRNRRALEVHALERWFFVWSFVVLFLSCRVLCCRGVVLVVSCVVLFLLCVCVCDLFLIVYVCDLFLFLRWRRLGVVVWFAAFTC